MNGLLNKYFWHSAKARYYNPQVSVWLAVDPLAEKYPNLSSYAFLANNPIMLVDPDGMRIEPPINFLGNDRDDRFVRLFAKVNNPKHFTKGDNFYPVYGHGNVGLISDRKSEPKNLIYDVKELDNNLKEKSAEFREARLNGEQVTECLLSCQSATKSSEEESSFAQEYSAQFPEDIIIGKDGYDVAET